MIYLDASNTTFLKQVGAKLEYIGQEEAAQGADWRPFAEWGKEDELSAEELQELFDSLIRCQAPIDRVPAHLREA